MKTKTKALALFLSAVLLVVTTVFTTMAFLTSTDEVKNTFTFGQVVITLDEKDVDKDSNDQDNVTIDGDVRDKANEYKLIPGSTYTKDPKIRVDAVSENCYLFVKVVNGLVNAEAAGDTTIAKQMENNGWVNVSDNIYVYCDENGNKCSVAGGGVISVFDSFTIGGNTEVSKFGDAKINVTAYAVQAEGFENDEPASIWNKVFAQQ